MKTLFNNIKAKLLAEVPELKQVALWNGQLTDANIKSDTNGMPIYAFPFPCVFVKFNVPPEITQLGMGVQMHDPLDIDIHIGHYQLDAGDGTMDQNVDVLDFKQDIFKALNKFCPVGAGSFTRINEIQDEDHTAIYHYIQTYRTSYVDLRTGQSHTKAFQKIHHSPLLSIPILLTLKNCSA
jgi:hypothetical protein